VSSGFCFVLHTHLGRIGLTHNCLASSKLIVENVLFSWINVHSTSIAHYHWSHCRQSMAVVKEKGSLLMDVNARAFVMTIGAYAEIIT